MPPAVRPQYRHQPLHPVGKHFVSRHVCQICSLLCHVSDAAEGPSSMIRGFSICVPDSGPGIKKACCLFIASRYQFPPIYWANFSSFPSPSISRWVIKRRKSPSQTRSLRFLRGFPDNPNRQNSVRGSTAKFGMQLHLQAAPRKVGQGELAIALNSRARWE